MSILISVNGKNHEGETFVTKKIHQIVGVNFREELVNDTHGETLCALPYSIKKYIKIEAWLSLTFFICS